MRNRKKHIVTASIISGLFLFFTSLHPAVAGKIRLSPDIVPLSKKELKALELTGTWSKGGPDPYLAGGKLVYVHGAGGIPTVVASPMQVSDVELQPGEVINEIVVGDSARWMVAEGMSGNTCHLFIKPVDSGLESSAVVTTDRRVYHLRLLSRQEDHIPYIGFVYTSDLRAELAASNAQKARDQQWNTTKMPQGESVDMAALNFNYRIRGDASWRPERVYDDGRKTYINLPESVRYNEMPVLLVKKGKKDVLVNFRVKGVTLEVDGLFETIALVIGVGRDKEVVEISRSNTKSRRPFLSQSAKMESRREIK